MNTNVSSSFIFRHVFVSSETSDRMMMGFYQKDDTDGYH